MLTVDANYCIYENGMEGVRLLMNVNVFSMSYANFTNLTN